MTDDQLNALLNLTQYPHLQIQESAIAREWIRQHGKEWDRIDFDVNLGSGVELDDSFDQTTKDQARMLTQKRADMIAWRGDDAALIEIKRRVDFAPLGQILGYATLFHVDFPRVKNLELWVIGWDSLLDAAEVLHAHGVTLETYPNIALVWRKQAPNPV